MTPILIFLFNFNPAMAIGTDILHGAIFKSFGGIRHRRLGTVRARLAGWMLLGSAPASSSECGPRPTSPTTLRRQRRLRAGPGTRLHPAVRVGSVRRQGALPSQQASGQPRSAVDEDRIVAVCIGLVGGFIVGLTSVRSGTLLLSPCSSSSPWRRSSSSGRTSPTLPRCSGSPGSDTSLPATST